MTYTCKVSFEQTKKWSLMVTDLHGKERCSLTIAIFSSHLSVGSTGMDLIDQSPNVIRLDQLLILASGYETDWKPLGLQRPIFKKWPVLGVLYHMCLKKRLVFKGFHSAHSLTNGWNWDPTFFTTVAKELCSVSRNPGQPELIKEGHFSKVVQNSTVHFSEVSWHLPDIASSPGFYAEIILVINFSSFSNRELKT